MTALNLPKIISGDGDSPATAIRFETCDLKTRKSAERQYIRDRFGEEGRDWSSDIHVTLAPFSFPETNALSELFRKAYEQFAQPPQAEKIRQSNSNSVGRDDFDGLISQWNIDLADGTSTRVYFDTSDTIYDD